MAYTKCQFKIPGLTLRGWKSGKPEEGIILALHGWLDNANSFLPLSKDINKNWQLISLDLPGHGLSDWIAKGASYHFIDYVTHIYRLCKLLPKNKKIVIMGHSLGAAIATILATCPIENLHSCILIDGLGPLCNPPEITHEKYLEFLASQEKLAAQKSHYYKNINDVIEKRLKVSPMNKDVAKKIIERGLVKKAKKGWTWRSDPRHMGRNPTRLTEDQIINFLENIQKPCLFVEAKTGEYFHFRYNVLGGRLKHSKKITHVAIDGNHHVHCDSPKEVSQSINSFLK